jgi:hypothetical protein
MYSSQSLFGTIKYQIYCNSYFCPNDMFNKAKNSFRYRTMEGMMNLVNQMKQLLKNNLKSAAVEISKQHYVHPFEVVGH